jgi:hypothetical protein
MKFRIILLLLLMNIFILESMAKEYYCQSTTSSGNSVSSTVFYYKTEDTEDCKKYFSNYYPEKYQACVKKNEQQKSILDSNVCKEMVNKKLYMYGSECNIRYIKEDNKIMDYSCKGATSSNALKSIETKYNGYYKE